MPTTYTDQFFSVDPGGAPAAGTALTATTYDFIDANDDGLIGTGVGDTFNGLAITNVWVGDTITVVMNGVTTTITGVTFYVTGGSPVFTPTDGTILSDAVLQSSTWVDTSTQIAVGSLTPACFVTGTLIETPDGPRAVECLRPGDLVLTRDNGAQPLRWIGGSRVEGIGKFTPVRFATGAVGNSRPLVVSPQHRILVTGWRAELLCGTDEVLVAACHLVDGVSVTLNPMPEVEYFHLLFDRHEIVFSESAPSESLYPGDFVLTGNPVMRAELLALFPELSKEAGLARWTTARHVLRAHEARLLAA